jgi:hypothetical protein
VGSGLMVLRRRCKQRHSTARLLAVSLSLLLALSLTPCCELVAAVAAPAAAAHDRDHAPDGGQPQPCAQWLDQEMSALAADDALPLRVDTLNDVPAPTPLAARSARGRRGAGSLLPLPAWEPATSLSPIRPAAALAAVPLFFSAPPTACTPSAVSSTAAQSRR